MKILRRKMKILKSVILIAALILTMFSPLSVTGNETSYPTQIDGLPVIYMQTHENTYSLSEGEVIITLMDKESKTAEESTSRLKLDSFLKEYTMPSKLKIEVYGGYGASIAKFLEIHEKNNKKYLECGRVSLGGPLSTDNPVITATQDHTYAAVRNNDPSSQTITGIGAYWQAPTIGTYQDRYSAFMVNAMTNTGYFMQSGQYYWNGMGYNVYADYDTGYENRDFNLAYHIGDLYEFSIYKSAGHWAMWCENRTDWEYDYFYELNSTGTRLRRELNTSVWFENFNTVSYWYINFTSPLSSYHAADCTTQWKAWNGQTIIIQDCNGQSQPNNNIITGSLVNYGYARWNLMNVLYVH
jgi:hypothetical protein